LCVWSSSGASVYIVDGAHGDDENDGDSVSTAFKTIAHCVKQLADPGDVCKVAKGRYHEALDINGLKGTAEKPFKIMGLDDDRPIWDGTVPIEPQTWDFDSKTGICSAPIGEDITALFLNDDLLTAARWPNSLWSNRTCFDNSFWGNSDKTSTRGRMVDNGDAGLAESGINGTGAMAILNVGSWATVVGEVLNHEVGSNSFTYDDHFGDLHWKAEKSRYYLEASLALLDAPEEWFYDMETKILYLIPKAGEGCPNATKDSLRGRTMDYGLTIRNTTGLTVANMTFFACNVDAVSVIRQTNIDEITLENINMLFGASSHRMLKSDKKPKWTKMIAIGKNRKKNKKDRRAVEENGWVYGKVSVINCTFSGTEGSALQYGGKGVYIHNNLFAWNDWTGHMMEKASGGLGTIFGETIGEEVSQNTLWYNGASNGIRSGSHGNISYNHVVGQCAGVILNDGAGMQFQSGAQFEANVNHNWVRDSPKAGIRFDSPGTRYGQNGDMEFNVVWNTSGLMVKGDYHQVRNNLALDKYDGEKRKDGEGSGCTLCVIYKLRKFPLVNNQNTIVINNGATHGDGGKNVATKPHTRFDLAGKKVENNYSGKNIRQNLYDSHNWDFRPLENSNFATGELIGPYEAGIDSLYWIPGRKLYKTSTPVPPSGSTFDSKRDVVMFLGAYNADYYHGYLATNEKDLEGEELGAGTVTMGTIEEGANVLTLPQLEPDKDYYWRVDTQWGGYTYRGDVWHFNTKP